MMRDDEGGRVSMVCERMAPSEAAFAALLRALAPLQSHAAGLRSVAYGASGSGGVREVTADERAIDAGALRAWAESLSAMADGTRADSRLALGDVEILVRAAGGAR